MALTLFQLLGYITFLQDPKVKKTVALDQNEQSTFHFSDLIKMVDETWIEKIRVIQHYELLIILAKIRYNQDELGIMFGSWMFDKNKKLDTIKIIQVLSVHVK